MAILKGGTYVGGDLSVATNLYVGTAGYGDFTNPYASKTANYFLAAPNGSAGSPTFRAVVAADIPTLNQSTTGQAGSVANALTISTGLSGSSYNGSSAVTIAIDSTVVTLAGSQALTNKSYNGYTLAAACAYAVVDSSSASAIGTGTSLTTERDIYYGMPTINNAHNYTSSTTIYAPSAGGAAGTILLGAGTTTAPTWSTSTIPTSAGSTAGKFLRSDATNYVLSTITIPDAAAAGDIWYASATNVITALPKGTNGQALMLVGGLPTWNALALRASQEFTATAGQTTFTVSGGYTSGALLDVFMNGMLLSPTDYTATDLSNVVLAVGASVNDLIRIVAYTTPSISGTASYASVAGAVRIVADDSGSGTKYPIFVGTSQTGDLVPNTDNGFTYVPSTGTLTSLVFSGAVSNPSSSASIGSGVVGQIHFTTPTNTYHQGITFAQGGSATPQAGIWVQNDNSAGTTMRFQTTNSYATGPQTRLTIAPDGVITAVGQIVANSFKSSSRRALKENILSYPKSALEILKKIDVVSFNFKTDPNRDCIGFIADDSPEEVAGKDHDAMDIPNILGLLIKAVQELAKGNLDEQST